MLFVAVPSLGAAQSPIEGEFDPFVSIAADATYGTRSVRVPAETYWVNTGVFLTASQTATITASGAWRVDAVGGTRTYGPGGTTLRTNPQNRCRVGQLVARVGMEVNTTIYCIGANGTVPARAAGEGILYLAANTDRNDGLDWTDYRRSAFGSLNAQITSAGTPAPTILADEAPDYDFSRVRSGLMEIRGAHVILTVPPALAQQDRNELPEAVLTLDRFYEMHTELHRAVPYHGQRIRFAKSDNIGGLMVAGNPIRMLKELTELGTRDRITNFVDPWGYAHELGHDFSVMNGAENYMWVDTWESWANVFTMHGHEQLGFAPTHGCNEAVRDAYLSDPRQTYASYFRSGPHQSPGGNDRAFWLQLCFWLELKDQYGWELYENFFDRLSVTDNSTIPRPRTSCLPNDFRCSDAPVWAWVRNSLNNAARQIYPGVDLTSMFQLYKIPVN